VPAVLKTLMQVIKTLPTARQVALVESMQKSRHFAVF